MHKLKEKNQSANQIQQARKAIKLFYKIGQNLQPENLEKTPLKLKDSDKPIDKSSTEPGLSRNQSWVHEYDLLKNEIKLRQYSIQTLKTYRMWVRKFQAYLMSKSPQNVDSRDARAFITDLAVKKKVSASTQNQAFNALLFFYRHVLKKEFGDFKDIPRAKRSKYVPTVLSRKEIDAIIQHLDYPFTLVVKLLYGCGLRLKEGLNVRVQDIDFEERINTYSRNEDCAAVSSA